MHYLISDNYDELEKSITDHVKDTNNVNYNINTDNNWTEINYGVNKTANWFNYEDKYFDSDNSAIQNSKKFCIILYKYDDEHCFLLNKGETNIHVLLNKWMHMEIKHNFKTFNKKQYEIFFNNYITNFQDTNYFKNIVKDINKNLNEKFFNIFEKKISFKYIRDFYDNIESIKYELPEYNKNKHKKEREYIKNTCDNNENLICLDGSTINKEKYGNLEPADMYDKKNNYLFHIKKIGSSNDSVYKISNQLVLSGLFLSNSDDDDVKQYLNRHNIDEDFTYVFGFICGDDINKSLSKQISIGVHIHFLKELSYDVKKINIKNVK
jgi:hypothetical protein